MNADEFNYVILEQIEVCQTMLGVKADEYATEDRLHNFNVAAKLQNQRPAEALAGMMAKHTVSVYDLIQNNPTDEMLWNEKITDHINYLLLLKAVMVEEWKTTMPDLPRPVDAPEFKDLMKELMETWRTNKA